MESTTATTHSTSVSLTSSDHSHSIKAESESDNSQESIESMTDRIDGRNVTNFKNSSNFNCTNDEVQHEILIMNDDYYDSEDRTLFVGDLPEDFTASNLAVIFAPFGAISDIQVKVIRTVRQPFSYAFIQFETKTAAQAAFESLDGNLAYGIGGTQLRLGWAHRNKSLHVGNLDTAVTEDDLHRLFGQCGELEALDGVVLFRRDIPGYTNYAHINFETRESATLARSRINNYVLHGRSLRVEWNRSPKKLTETLAQAIMTHETQSLPVTVALAHQDATLIDASGVGKSTYLCSPVLSIYVQFETLQEDARVTETSLREVFEPFGLVTGCFIKSNYVSNNGRRQYGYGFVHFESSDRGRECAQTAAETVGCSTDQPYVYEGAIYRCEVSKNYRRATGTLQEEHVGQPQSQPQQAMSNFGSVYYQYGEETITTSVAGPPYTPGYMCPPNVDTLNNGKINMGRPPVMPLPAYMPVYATPDGGTAYMLHSPQSYSTIKSAYQHAQPQIPNHQRHQHQQLQQMHSPQGMAFVNHLMTPTPAPTASSTSGSGTPIANLKTARLVPVAMQDPTGLTTYIYQPVNASTPINHWQVPPQVASDKMTGAYPLGVYGSSPEQYKQYPYISHSYPSTGSPRMAYYYPYLQQMQHYQPTENVQASIDGQSAQQNNQQQATLSTVYFNIPMHMNQSSSIHPAHFFPPNEQIMQVQAIAEPAPSNQLSQLEYSSAQEAYVPTDPRLGSPQPMNVPPPICGYPSYAQAMMAPTPKSMPPMHIPVAAGWPSHSAFHAYNNEAYYNGQIYHRAHFTPHAHGCADSVNLHRRQPHRQQVQQQQQQQATPSDKNTSVCDGTNADNLNEHVQSTSQQHEQSVTATLYNQRHTAENASASVKQPVFCEEQDLHTPSNGDESNKAE